LFLSILSFSLVLVLCIHISSAAVIPSSEIGVDNKTPVYTSEYGNNDISSDKVENYSADPSQKMTSTNGLKIRNVATSTDESDMNENADVSINQVVSNNHPNYLKSITFSIVVKNNGPNIAQNVIACDWFNPSFFKYISDDGKGTYNYKTGLWDVGTLNNGTKNVLHVVLQVVVSKLAIKNNASITSSSPIDNNSTNNQAETNLIVPATADIRLTQTASKYNPIYLQNITLTVVVKNNGPNTAQNVTANCWLNPKLLMYLVNDGKGSYNHQTGIWNIGTLRSGSTKILHIRTKMMMFRTTSTYRVVKNQFTTTSTTYDSSQKNNKAVIVLAVPRITIKTLAKSLAIGTKSKFDRAVNIFNWVRDYVDYSYYYGTRYGASGTLKLLKGNCVDLSHLIVALARASGLPVRYKYGTCFFLKGQHWISHVWTNIYVKGRWYAADASNNINEFGVVKSWNTSNYKLNGIYTTLPF
jgi:uncharacterized repeat protein (TIGR01451 family)